MRLGPDSTRSDFTAPLSFCLAFIPLAIDFGHRSSLCLPGLPHVPPYTYHRNVPWASFLHVLPRLSRCSQHGSVLADLSFALLQLGLPRRRYLRLYITGLVHLPNSLFLLPHLSASLVALGKPAPEKRSFASDTIVASTRAHRSCACSTLQLPQTQPTEDPRSALP